MMFHFFKGLVPLKTITIATMLVSTLWIPFKVPTLFEKLECKFENEKNGRRKSWGTLLNS
jgi:hypothetical protein